MNLQEQGLSEKAVLRSRHQHGSNVLAPPERESLWHKFIEKFRDPIIMILLVALLLSFGVASYEYWWVGDRDLSHFLEPLGVLLSVLLATGVAFVVLLLGLMQFFKHRELGDGLGLELSELLDYYTSSMEGTMTAYELSFFFAFFVFLKFQRQGLPQWKVKPRRPLAVPQLPTHCPSHFAWSSGYYDLRGRDVSRCAPQPRELSGYYRDDERRTHRGRTHRSFL